MSDFVQIGYILYMQSFKLFARSNLVTTVFRFSIFLVTYEDTFDRNLLEGLVLIIFANQVFDSLAFILWELANRTLGSRRWVLIY